jgi:hypothetical protein
MFSANNLKIVLSWLVLSAIVFTGPGFTLSAHFCNGQLKTMSVISQEDPCEKETTEACCKHAQKPSPKPCCTSSHESPADACELESDTDCCETKVYHHPTHGIKAYFQYISVPSPISIVLFSGIVNTNLLLTDISKENLTVNSSILDFRSYVSALFQSLKCVFII